MDSVFTVSSTDFEPAYLALHRSGELRRRAQQAVQSLADCRVCPRNCGVNRLADRTAACKTGRYAKVGSYFPHFGEEDCLRGWNGSGTIFFSLCNLRCVFCQNYDISQVGEGQETSAERLAEMSRMLLQTQPPAIEPDRHCHTPYDCPFWEHCTKDKPARWIHYLPGSKHVVGQLTQQGVTTIDEIPAGTKLSPVQRRVKENVEWVSAKLGPLLKAVQYRVLDWQSK